MLWPTDSADRNTNVIKKIITMFDVFYLRVLF